jgi:hypothetical protein
MRRPERALLLVALTTDLPVTDGSGWGTFISNRRADDIEIEEPNQFAEPKKEVSFFTA